MQFFSEILNREIYIDEVTKKLLNENSVNKNRIFSIAQKYRKKTLNKIVTEDYQLNDEIINTFNKLARTKIGNVNEYLNFDFHDFIDQKQKKDIEIFKVENTKHSKIAENILSLFNKNLNDCLSIIIHGSQADGNVTFYSDIDISIFINASLLRNLNDVKEIKFHIDDINRQINLYDPTTHHTSFLNLETDLNCYPESFMPINVFQKGLFSSSKDKLVFLNTRFDLDLKIENFYNLISKILQITNKLKVESQYELKELISSYFMLLILEYEIITSEFLDKRTIFTKKIYEYRKVTELAAFKEASKIREGWPNLELDKIYTSNNFLKLILEDIERMFSNIQNREILEKISDLYLK